jgi:hypothetical protein
MLDFFREVWHDGREHKSVISGKPLFFDVSIFAHVLSRGSHPELKYDHRNVVLMTPEEHHTYDFMTHLARKDPRFNKVFELAEELKRL